MNLEDKKYEGPYGKTLRELDGAIFACKILGATAIAIFICKAMELLGWL